MTPGELIVHLREEHPGCENELVPYEVLERLWSVSSIRGWLHREIHRRAETSAQMAGQWYEGWDMHDPERNRSE